MPTLSRPSTSPLLFTLFLATLSCKSSPQLTADSHHTTPARPPHPWPMVHHDARRSGGAMDTPFKEAPPATPQLLSLPGKLHHLNAPVISRDRLGCVGSVGERLDTPDPHDGVYCVDLDTFTLAAFLHTNHDAWHTTLGDAHLFVTTANAELIAIELSSLREGKTPRVAWQRQLPEVASSPTLIPSPSPDAPLLVADEEGDLLSLAQGTGEILWQRALPSGVKAPLSAHDRTLVVATLGGDVLAIDLPTGETIWQTTTTYLEEDDLAAFESTRAARLASHEAAPILDPSRRLVVITYLRDSPQSTPPILAIDLESGELRWEASANTPHRAMWYNQPVAPVLVEDRVIFIEPFSALTASVSLDDGRMLFLSSRPSCIQQQRSSIVHAADINYVPRHDGTLYAMSSGYGLSPWFVFPHAPSTRSARNAPYFESFRAAYEGGVCLANPPEHSGFLTTPALTATGDILVGRADGTLLLYR